MFRTVHNIWADRRRRRKEQALQHVRRQFETCGYSVSGVSDSELEAAVNHSGRRIDDATPLTAKRAFWILRRLSPDVTPLRRLSSSRERSAELY